VTAVQARAIALFDFGLWNTVIFAIFLHFRHALKAIFLEIIAELSIVHHNSFWC